METLPLLLILVVVSPGGSVQMVPQCAAPRKCRCAALGTPDKLPALATIRSTVSSHVCAGVLINDRYVLATADCGRDLSFYESLSVLSVTLQDSEEKLFVEEVTLHPQYLKTALPREYDVMLIRLNSTLNMEVTVPVCLPDADELVYEGMAATVVGPHSRAVNVEIKDGSCSFRKQHFGRVRTVRVRSKQFLCAGEVVTRYCDTAPGSVLLIPRHGWYAVVGIASSLDLFPMCGQSQGLFTRILPHRLWLKETAVNASTCQYER